MIKILFIFICFFLQISCNVDSALMQISKTKSIGKFIPKDLVNFNGIKVSKRIVPDLKKLLKAAQREGLNLKVVSGYRSFEYQKKTFNNWVNKELKKNPKLIRKQAIEIANCYSAKPGHSEHQLGTTVDILSSENNFKFEGSENLRFAEWLEKNCQKFNFKISYPKTQKEYVYEPWHLRWYPK